MNTRQKRTLQTIYAKPTKNNIPWQDIEKLMVAIGATVKVGKSSAGVFILNKKILPFHRPHPQKEAKRYQVDDLRKFLSQMEIVP